MVKIKKAFYPVAILADEMKAWECRREMITMKILLSSESKYDKDTDKLLLSYIFDTEASRDIFTFKLGATPSFFPVSLQIIGTKNEVREKIVEFVRIPKLSIQAIPFEGGALMLIVFETKEEAEKASKETP